MTKLKIPLLSLEARGPLGGVLSVDNRSRSPRVRKKPIPSQPRTLAQMYQRWLYQDYVAWWHTLPAATKQTWETNARRLRITGFNYWMRTRLTLKDDIALMLRLDERGGNIAHDTGPNANHGTIFGAQHVTGIIDHALSFDGVDDYVQCPDHPSLNITDTLTLEAYINSNVDQVGGYRSAIGKLAQYDLYFDHANLDFRGAIGIRSATTWYNSDGPVSITKDEPHHLLGTYDGTFLRFYVDGIERASRNIGTITINVTANDLYVGATTPALNRFSGLVDNPTLYNRALTLPEIKLRAERRYPL